MSTKHISRAVCAIQQRRHEQPFKYTYKTGCRSGPFTGHRRTVVFDLIGDVEMTIDLTRLIDWMGRRALASKSGVSKLQGGMITAKARNTRTANEKVVDNMPAYAPSTIDDLGDA